MEFQRHDKVLCRILNYIPKERSFEVEDVISHTKGWVIFVNHYQDIPPMKEAYNNHKTLPLYFDKYEGGIPLFAYRIYNDNIKRESASNNQVVNSDVLSVSMCFSNSNSDYNSQLFEALYNTLGDAIDSEEKYNKLIDDMDLYVQTMMPDELNEDIKEDDDDNPIKFK